MTGLKISRSTTLVLFLFIMFSSFSLASAGDGNFKELAGVYRISMIIATTSDWMTISSDGISFLSSKVTILQGANVSGLRVWQDGDKIGINKPALNTELVKINVTMIVTLSKCSSVQLKIQRGDLGYTYVKILNLNLGTPKLVTEFNHSQVIAGDPTNLKTIFLSCEKLREGGPLKLPGSGGAVPKMTWAFYYPWYYSDQWDTDPALTDTPLLGKYSSDDPRAIRAHIRLAKAAGIDGFIVSWWGRGTYTDKNLKKILTIASEEGFNVTIYFESLRGDGSPRSPVEIKNMLREFLKTYDNDERYFHLWGKPVIFVWAVDSHPVNVWREIIDGLRDEGYDAIYIANTLNPQYLEVFDGLHTYGTIKLNLNEAYKRASLQCKTYPLLGGNSKIKIWAATISPGYDDRHVPGRKGYYQPRMGGEYYILTFKAAMESEPDWLLITTFNEFPENTFIEPSKRYGFKYILMTANFTAEFKGIKSNITALLELKKGWRLDRFSHTQITSTKSSTITTTSFTTQSTRSWTTSSSSTTTALPVSNTKSNTVSSSSSASLTLNTETISQIESTETKESGKICGTGALLLLATLLVLIFIHVRR